MMDAETKKKVLARLRRAAGQVAAIERMVEEDQYCVDVLLQIAAAQAALGKVGEITLARHIETCVSDAFESGNEGDKIRKVGELMEVFSRYAKLGR